MGEGASIQVEQGKNGATILRLIDGNRNSWKLKDESRDILVTRDNNRFYKIDMEILSFKEVVSVSTRVKAAPGQTVALGGMNGEQIVMEFPRK